MDEMNNKENSRMIMALRERGWTDTEINDLVLYMDTGEQQWFDRVTKNKENQKEKAD